MIREKQDQILKEVPVTKWTKKTGFASIFKKDQQEFFYFNELPEPLTPLTIEINGNSFKWENGFWKTQMEVEAEEKELLNDEQLREIEEENKDLEAQIEFLLDLNTNYELEKAQLHERFRELEEQIRNFPGVMESGDDF